jgi:hypothetical protein
MSHAEHGDTQEFKRLELEPGPGRVEHQLVGFTRLSLWPDLEYPVELALGVGENLRLDVRTDVTPEFVLRPVDRRDEEEGRSYVLLQPAVFGRKKGTAYLDELGGSAIRLGREDTECFDFADDVSRRHLLLRFRSHSIEIENYGRNGTRVLVHPDDMLGEIEEFDSTDTWSYDRTR